MIGKRAYFERDGKESRKGVQPYHEEKVTLEESIRELGAKKASSSLEEVKRLVEEIKPELKARQNIIICTLIECISTTRFKIPAYTTLVGFLNQRDEDFGSDFVESLAIALQDALDDHDPKLASNIVLEMCDLINVNVVQASSVISLLETFLVTAIDSQSTAIYSEWLLTTVISALPFIAECFEKNRVYNEAFEKLFNDISSAIKNRKNEYMKGLRIWVHQDTFTQMEYIDQLWRATLKLQKNKWNTDVMQCPYENIKEDFTSSKSHKFTTTKLPLNFNIQKFSLPKIILQIFDEKDCQDFKICNQHLPDFDTFDRVYISQKIIDIVESNEEPRKSVFLIKSMIRDSSMNIPYIICESLINKILIHHDYSGSHIKYYAIIMTLHEMYKEIFSVVINQAVENIFINIEHMNIQSLHKFIHWFVFYINNLNCEFNWNIFDDVFELETPQPKILFFTAVVSKLYDIIDASKNSILTDLIKKLSVPKRDFYLQFNSDDSKLQIMRVLAFGIKEKKNNQQIIQDLENNARQLKFDSIIGPILTTLLKGGYKTPSHTISIIDKYSSILEQFNKNENDHMECISAAYYFWKNNPTRIKHIIQLLEQRKFINSHDILNWFLNLQYEQKSVELLPWDVIFTYINIYTCNFIKYKTEYSKLKIIDKTKESYDLGENQQQQSDEQLTTAKHKKETAKEERKKLLLLIVEKICVCISNYVEDCQAQNKPLVCTWFVYILQRLQQILFENIGCFCYLHEFLQSLIDFSNNEEHVVEILKRFQSIYT